MLRVHLRKSHLGVSWVVEEVVMNFGTSKRLDLVNLGTILTFGAN